MTADPVSGDAPVGTARPDVVVGLVAAPGAPAELAGDPPPETMRRLMGSVMEHQAGQLQDDASIVMVEWRTGREEQLQP